MSDFPEDLIQDALELLQKTTESGKIRRGTNEVTKAIERGKALLVFISEDVSPSEIVRHLPILAKEKNTPFIVIPSAEALGSASGLDVPTASSAIVDIGNLSSTLSSIADKVKEFN